MATEYVAPIIALLGITYYFLHLALSLESKAKSEAVVFDFVDIARFLLIAVSLGFGLLSLDFGLAVVNNDVVSMANFFNTTTIVYLGVVGLMFLGLLVYVFWVVPYFLKQGFKTEKERKERTGEADED